MTDVIKRQQGDLDEAKYTRFVDTANHNRNREIVTQLVGLFAETERGHIISWAALHGATGIADRESLYPLLSRAKKMLIKHHRKFLETRPGVGYLVVPYGEEIHQCTGQFWNGVKQMSTAVKNANHIPLSDMASDAQSVAIEKTQKMANFLSVVTVEPL